MKEAYILYDSRTFWKRQNSRESKNISGHQGLVGGVGEKGMNKWGLEDSQGSDNPLYDTIVKDTCPYTFVQTHGVCTTRREPSHAHWIWGDDAVSV